MLSDRDLQEIKAMHAMRRRCWRQTLKHPYPVTPLEQRLDDKWAGVDVVGVLLDEVERLKKLSEEVGKV